MQKLWSIVIAMSLLIASTNVVIAEGEPSDPQTASEKQATNCAGVCFPLTASSNVSESVSVEAVLIPYNIAKRVFGREIAMNYAVVQLIVGNHNPKATFIIQSLFLDYTNWSLSGLCKDKEDEEENKGSNPFIQAHNYRSQVGSVESRMVRSQMLDKQPTTTRNLVIGSMVALGTAGTAFAFPFSTDVIKGIGAWNGAVVPGAQNLFPDHTIRQLNNISDFGFQTNKAVPKQSSEPIVGFFPIDRFLTPTFAHIFRKYPAAFFVPREMAADPKVSKQLLTILKQVNPEIDQKVLGTLITKKCSNESVRANNPEICDKTDLLDGVSLNKIRVYVSGDMSVDEQSIPPRIDDATFDNFVAGKSETFWTTLNTAQIGTIRGEFFTNAEPTLVDDKGTAISDKEMSIAKVTEGSTDSVMKVTITFKTCPKQGQRINIQLTKQAAGTSDSKIPKVISNSFALGDVAYPDGSCKNPAQANTAKPGGTAPIEKAKLPTPMPSSPDKSTD